MRPNPLHDALVFLTTLNGLTIVFWLLLLGSLLIAIRAWRATPGQNSPRLVAFWLIRLVLGIMWWQQSLWKVPPNYDGLLYWMQQMVEHSSVPLQGQLVNDLVIPNIAVFGPLIYSVEVAIGVSLMLGALTRLGALLGLGMAVNLWLGLYSAPNEWPWTYGFLVLLQLLFVIDPPGRALGLDALWRRRGSVLGLGG